MVNSILSAGVQGVQRGISAAQENAQTIASGSSSPAELAEPLLSLKLNLVQVQASGKVVEVVDEILSTITDIRNDER